MKSECVPRALVISNIPWDFVWQRHQSIACLLNQDNEVGFIELAGTRAPRLREAGRVIRHILRSAGGDRAPSSSQMDFAVDWISRPLVLPATTPLYKRINRWRLRRWVSRDPRLSGMFDLVVTYPQTRTALQLLDLLSFRRLVYDCTDDWLEVEGVPDSLAEDEKELLGRADLTLVPSHVLWSRKNPLARRCSLLPHGAWLERFSVEDKVRTDGAVTCLYFGHLLRQHLDFAAIEALAEAEPGWRILLVGPVKSPHRFPPNVELIGQVPHELLIEWVKIADVILLPYVVNDYTAAVMPAKTYEVLATGRPVVAAPLPALKLGFSEHMLFAEHGAEWPNAVARALSEDNAEKRAARRAASSAHSWQARYRELQKLLAGVPDSRKFS